MADVHSRGISIKQNKSDLLAKNIYAAGLEDELFFSVTKGAEILVTKGEKLAQNRLLAADEKNDLHFYSPANATVTDIYDSNHPLMGEVSIIKMSSSKAGISPRLEEDAESMRDLTGGMPERERKLDSVKASHIIDVLDSRSLYRKMTAFAKSGVRALCINAIEDESFSCSETALLIHKFAEVSEGLHLLAEAAGIKESAICIYKLRAADLSGLAKRDGVVVVSGKYPVSARYTAQAKRTGFVGAQTCYDYYNYVNEGERQTKVFVTVGGDRLKAPKNMLVPVGTPIGKLLDKCEPAKEAGIIVVGDGPMTGRYTNDLETPVTVGMKSILLLKPVEIKNITNCWGCAECARVCPQGLMPLAIARFARHNMTQEAAQLGAERCIGCGCCSYICSGGIDPMRFILEAKGEIEQIEQTEPKPAAQQKPRKALFARKKELPKSDEQ